MRRHRIQIGGLKWTLEVGGRMPPDRWGDTTPPTSKNRRIRVSGAARGEKFVDVLIHELIHARWWNICESEVTEFAKEITAILRLFPEEVMEAIAEDD